MLEALLVSTLVVAVGELGDKTQLLTLVLAARYRRPWPIIAGILVATLANHTVAASIGQWVRDAVAPEIMRWGLALSFFAVAAWALKPDQFDESDAPPVSDRSVFVVTVVAFFLAEMGDKTQIATVALAAKYSAVYSVVAGTTLGMMLADVPAVLLGERVTKLVPARVIRVVAAVVFLILGAMALLNVGRLL
jgi:putative Ca2+/H+ antiporter (TMEM165/GDT1 family)